MSWDIFVQDLPADATTLDDIPHDFAPQPLGLRAEIIATILAVVPYANFTDPTWGMIDAPEFSVEVNLGRDELVDAFALHVRGGSAAVACVVAILDALGARALDAESGDIFNREAALERFERWRSYRDQAIAADS